MKAKRWIVICISLVLLFSCCSVSARPVSGHTVSAVAVSQKAPDQDKILSARFLNMLNHNFAYNEAYRTEEALVNAAAVSLRNFADEDGFIPAAMIAGNVKDFYGVDVKDFSAINTDFEQKEGYVYLIPRGFTQYTHSLVSLVQNEDRTYTVLTRMSQTAHDGTTASVDVETLFVPDSASSFGFHIVRSEILENLMSI